MVSLASVRRGRRRPADGGGGGPARGLRPRPGDRRGVAPAVPNAAEAAPAGEPAAVADAPAREAVVRIAVEGGCVQATRLSHPGGLTRLPTPSERLFTTILCTHDQRPLDLHGGSSPLGHPGWQAHSTPDVWGTTSFLRRSLGGASAACPGEASPAFTRLTALQSRASDTTSTAKGQLAMREFVDRRSIVRTIWGSPDLILLIFAGAAAEFALNRAVDWLFFTGYLPRDPLGRLFATVRYAQEIVFVTEEAARRTLERIHAIHGAVERQRGQPIPAWAHRAVLYMLVDYSERAYGLLYRPLSAAQQQELYTVFRRIGDGLRIPELPATYAEWHRDRYRHLGRDLAYSRQTARLFRQYRRHLGRWRYDVLLQVQAVLVPEEVRRLLHLRPHPWFSRLVRRYGIVARCHLHAVVHRLLIPSRYRAEVRKLDGRVAAEALT
jgi:uncharacterized protein (DUF2236 family)